MYSPAHTHARTHTPTKTIRNYRPTPSPRTRKAISVPTLTHHKHSQGYMQIKTVLRSPPIHLLQGRFLTKHSQGYMRIPTYCSPSRPLANTLRKPTELTPRKRAKMYREETRQTALNYPHITRQIYREETRQMALNYPI